jgi:hypothetical protein
MSSNDGPTILVRGQGTPPVKLRSRPDPGLFSKGPGVARSYEPGSDECIGRYPAGTPTGESAVDSTPRAQGATSPDHSRWAKGGVASSLEDVSAARPGGSARADESAGTGRRVRWVELDGQRLPGDTLPLSDGLATHNVRVQLG